MPTHFDTYDDLKRLGIDVVTLNSTELSTTSRHCSGSTRTLFKLKLVVATFGMEHSVTAASPTISLDELT